MKFVPVERPKRKYGIKQQLVKEFLNMNVDYVEAQDTGDPYVFASAFNNAAKSLKIGCRARVINKKVYIFRNENKKENENG